MKNHETRELKSDGTTFYKLLDFDLGQLTVRATFTQWAFGGIYGRGGSSEFSERISRHLGKWHSDLSCSLIMSDYWEWKLIWNTLFFGYALYVYVSTDNEWRYIYNDLPISVLTHRTGWFRAFGCPLSDFREDSKRPFLGIQTTNWESVRHKCCWVSGDSWMALLRREFERVAWAEEEI